jgi:two-component system, OmpR family, sensor histidine kinase KdpD
MKAFRSLLWRLRQLGLHVHRLADHLNPTISSAWPDGGETAQVRFEVMRILARTALYPVACVALTTALMALVLRYTALEFESIVYLIPVLICAIRWGFVSAIVGICASAGVADFLFIPPFYSFVISDPKQIVEIALFLFVALVTSNLAARLKSEVDTSHRREREIQNLYEFSRRLALCSTAGDLIKAIQDYLSVRLGCKAHLIRLASFHAGDGGAEDEMVPQSIAREAKEMIAARESGSRRVTEPATNSLWALKHITTTTAEHGVLAVNLGKPRDSDADKLNDRIDALLLEAIATLTRIDAAAALAKANIRLESEILRTALVGTASHELRSPVAAILGTASVLDQMLALQGDEKVRSLVDGMHLEAKRLEGDIQNLLDTARITDTGVEPRLLWTDPADILAAAIRQRSHRLATRKLSVDVDPKLPLVNVDPVLLEQAIGQLIENAVKYSPAGSGIAIAGRVNDGQVVLAVTDRGVGLTEEEARHLFQRAYRGRRHLGNVPGLGLGLWIARIFVAANGGTLSADSPGTGLGTTMSIRLPVAPSMAPELVSLSDAQSG